MTAPLMNSLNTWPIWLSGVVILFLCLLAAYGGLRLRRRDTRRDEARGEAYDDTYEGYIVSGVLGLLALLMGFTFSMAVDRYDARRSLVLEEANAIGTTYLRTQLLEEPHRARISGLLVAYTDNRVAISKIHHPNDDARRRVEENDRLITELWAATASAFQTIKGMDFSSSYLESMNSLIDLDTSRKVARIVRVPAEVFLVLALYMIVTAGVMGYVLIGRRGQWSGVWLLVLLTMALMLIMDIDRPGRGGIGESQRPLEAQLASMKSIPTTAYDRYLTQDTTAQSATQLTRP
ncbi:hypothetical protein [Brevundimonas lenta]|uniref:DUF4239 domain-containing protein n=1 Tax=Brevundimonas lenta TaxID=424796 RepID=A0A7W6JC75_9CAUL|nr:hypothetical protein [Brevundimonas lenta]MBB4082361.1 hypothetical protein [Brevundimonas lenta]